jgi:hypothetical protein
MHTHMRTQNAHTNTRTYTYKHTQDHDFFDHEDELEDEAAIAAGLGGGDSYVDHAESSQVCVKTQLRDVLNFHICAVSITWIQLAVRGHLRLHLSHLR